MIRWISLIVLSAMVVLAAPGSGSAQAPGAPQGPRSGSQQGREMSREEREALVERTREMYSARMARELRLTPEQSAALQEIFSAYEGPRREIAAQKRRVIGEAQRLPIGAGSEERALALLAENSRIREREATLLREEEARLLQVLSPSQVLALQIFREQLSDQIRGATNPLGSPSQWGRSGGAGSTWPFPQR
jgi:hypothetical protein